MWSASCVFHLIGHELHKWPTDGRPRDAAIEKWNQNKICCIFFFKRGKVEGYIRWENGKYTRFLQHHEPIMKFWNGSMRYWPNDLLVPLAVVDYTQPVKPSEFIVLSLILIPIDIAVCHWIYAWTHMELCRKQWKCGLFKHSLYFKSAKQPLFRTSLFWEGVSKRSARSVNFGQTAATTNLYWVHTIMLAR